MSLISGEKDHALLYLSDLSRDWVAPKGIACTRVLPTTQIQHNTNTGHNRFNTKLSHITDTANKAQNKNKLQEITKRKIKHDRKLGIALWCTERYYIIRDSVP